MKTAYESFFMDDRSPGISSSMLELNKILKKAMTSYTRANLSNLARAVNKLETAFYEQASSVEMSEFDRRAYESMFSLLTGNLAEGNFGGIAEFRQKEANLAFIHRMVINNDTVKEGGTVKSIAKHLGISKSEARTFVVDIKKITTSPLLATPWSNLTGGDYFAELERCGITGGLEGYQSRIGEAQEHLTKFKEKIPLIYEQCAPLVRAVFSTIDLTINIPGHPYENPSFYRNDYETPLEDKIREVTKTDLKVKPEMAETTDLEAVVQEKNEYIRTLEEELERTQGREDHGGLGKGSSAGGGTGGKGSGGKGSGGKGGRRWKGRR